MARKKVLSVALAAMLATNTIWSAAPVSYDVTALAKAQETETENQESESEVTVEANQVNASLCENSKDGVILHAFCWSFNTIKENMADIAEAGFTTVQTSPINQCLEGEGGGMDLMGNGKWYYHYQPTDWKIGNYQLGSREEYIAMCDEAEKYGVKIISDVLPNHTTPTLNAVSQELINAAGGDLYHANGFHEITQWTDRYECTTGQMGGLPDVNTENKGFQEYYLKFCNDVIACGGDGFRYDTAKHIGVPSDPKDAKSPENDFWPVASGQKAVNGVKLSNPDKLFIYGEVLMDQGIPYEEYGKYINMTNSGYGGKLRSVVGSKNFNSGDLSNWGHPIPDKTVTWVESHDTYCNDGESVWMTNEQIRACWAVITARKQGTPLFMSRPMGSTNTKDGRWGNNKIGERGNDEFKHPEVVAVNHFRTAMVGEGEYLSNFGGNDCLVIERGNKGAVIINMGSQKSNVKLNKVADGTYTEEVSGQTVQVSGGTLNYTVPGGSIAVVYDTSVLDSVKEPKVSASKASGSTFSEPFELTLTAKNTVNVTYETSEGVTGSFTSGSEKISIGETCSVGDEVTVKVSATGEEGTTPVSETFTYTMAEAPAYKLYVRAKKSDFTSAPNAYVYAESGATATKYNGEWPGAAMTEEGDYYVFSSTEIDSAKIIFSYDGGQDPAQEMPGYDVSGYMEYDKSAKSVKAFTPQSSVVKTKAPANNTATPKVTQTPGANKETEPPTTQTDKPTVTTTAPVGIQERVTVSVADGTSFDTETMQVKLGLVETNSGTYRVDNGPIKKLTGDKTITVGQGKIADSDITLEVKTGNYSETYVYHKVFNADKAEVKAAAVQRIQKLFEVVADAAEVDASAETEGFYATNPDGKVGKEAKITIDGDFSDWSEDMLIAQGAAWDIANNFKGGHENCVLDDYALYGAWDDENLYIGWQMVNTTDTWAKGGDGPLSDGGRVLDVPLMLAINVGNRHAMTGKMANGKLIWDALDITFETRVDNILLMSGKVGLGTPGYFIATDDKGGASYEPDYCLSFKAEGISYAMAEGCLPKTINMLEGATDVSDIYDTSKYVDAMSKGHDTSYDSFYEINIPLKTLGINKSYLEENGIGVMQIATRGTSGIDCLPRDPSMMDNALGDCAVDPSTSHEKDDEDIITVPLAAVGNMKAGGDGSGGSISTKAPTNTDEPVESDDPVDTDEPADSDDPATAKPTQTPATQKATATPGPTSGAPTNVPTVSTKPTKAPSNYGDSFTVNFGADRSAPQYDSTALTLKAVAYPENESYQYEFFVDDQSVQASASNTYSWSGASAGTHIIKVVATNSDGDKISSEKSYVLEASGSQVVDPDNDDNDNDQPIVTDEPNYDMNVGNKETPKPQQTATASVSASPNANATATPAVNASATPVADDSKLSVTLDTDKASPQNVGTAITLSLQAKGGTGPYKYMIKVENANGKVSTLLSNGTENKVVWKPTAGGTYKLYGVVTDSSQQIETTTVSYTVNATLKIKQFKVNRTTLKKGKKLKIAMSATSKSAVKYKVTAKKSGSSKVRVIRGFSTKRTATWKPTARGKYTLYLTVKNQSGETKTVHLSKKITVK